MIEALLLYTKNRIAPDHSPISAKQKINLFGASIIPLNALYHDSK
tara:strand:- start:201 stop:335 length:135 start_codon:yes stop_codon:yes gene_type:complete